MEMVSELMQFGRQHVFRIQRRPHGAMQCREIPDFRSKLLCELIGRRELFLRPLLEVRIGQEHVWMLMQGSVKTLRILLLVRTRWTVDRILVGHFGEGCCCCWFFFFKFSSRAFAISDVRSKICVCWLVVLLSSPLARRIINILYLYIITQNIYINCSHNHTYGACAANDESSLGYTLPLGPGAAAAVAVKPTEQHKVD